MAIRHHLHDLLVAIAASRLTRGGLALAIIFLVGSTGFVVIEGWSLFDAVYMTVLTMTTVGYEEVRPLSPLGRVFNLFIMLGGVGLMLYILTVTVADRGRGRGIQSIHAEATNEKEDRCG